MGGKADTTVLNLEKPREVRENTRQDDRTTPIVRGEAQPSSAILSPLMVSPLPWPTRPALMGMAYRDCIVMLN